MKKLASLLAFCICLFSALSAQDNLAEKLGYDKDAKLLIIHADDAGLSHSVDAATIAAFEKEGITSASIQVPCPWFPEIAEYAAEHPEFDWGIHLTLTAEWKHLKWGGVMSDNDISSLLDENGFFYSSVAEFAKNADLEEVEAELRAQIERAMAYGIEITHLDSHMGALFASPELVKIYQELGNEYGLPVLQTSMLPMEIDNRSPAVDGVFMANQNVSADDWHKYYDDALKQLKPGLNEIIVHLAYDNEEMQAVTIDHPDFGSAWRQNDFDYVTSSEFRALLKKYNIKLIDWGEIKDATK